MIRKLFNDNWYFKKGDEVIEEINQDFECLNLPHTYNNIDGQDGGDDYYRGYAIYAKQFKCDEYPKTYIEFNGVGQSCEVFLNNHYLGRHDGGYSIFRFDLTDYLKEDNLLVVKVDNTKNNKVYPQMADFTFYGGIYRDVYLIHGNMQHFDIMDHGSKGVIVTPRIVENKCEVEIEAWFTGGDEIEFNIGELNKKEKVNGNYFKCAIEIDNPHLWDGLNDPYLYKLNSKLYKDNELKDELDINFGIRQFKVDPNEGFFLNGKPYPLRGVSKHQDRLDVGNAVSKENLEEDIEIIKELGATTIRLAHYQHDQYFYDLCDENGLIIWAEIPYISKHMPTGKENTLSQMEELIKQNYNHPCIVCWGLSNEITIGGGAESESLLDNHRELNDLVHKLDKTRLTTMAHVMSQDPHGSIIDIPDIASYNHYYGWYVGETSGYAKFFDKFHAEHPNHCIGLSEYGADANPKLHSNNPKKGDYSEEYQAKYHEEVLAFINERKYLWASHVWNMFDFAADARREGGNEGKNQKGLVTMDRKLKKDSFYLYKAYWNNKEEFVHICSSRYVNRDEDITLIKVYSNMDEVSLYVDDKLFETQKADKIFRFEVPISKEHKIVAKTNNAYDEINIRHVEEKDMSYILEDNGALNWFKETDESCFSIDDTYGDLMANEEAKRLVDELMAKAIAARGELAQNVQISDDMMEMMNSMRLSSLFAFGGDGVTSKDIQELNDKLQKIKK